MDLHAMSLYPYVDSVISCTLEEKSKDSVVAFTEHACMQATSSNLGQSIPHGTMY